MKKLLKNLVYFMIPVVALLVTIEYMAERIPNEYSVKNDYLDKNSDRVEVLYLGNSHVYFGINPDYALHQSYNASYISQSLDLDQMILDKYHWKNLKFIVIPADYVSMYYTLETANDKWRIKNYNLYYHFGIGYNPINYTEIFNGKIQDQIKRIEHYYIQNKYSILSTELGFGTAYQSPSPFDIDETAEKAAKLHTFDIHSKKHLNNFEINKKALNKIVSFAKEKQIKVIFLSSPVSPKYFQNCEPIQLARTMKVYGDLLKKYPEICSHIDFVQSPYFNNNDFYDGDHLNNIGAEKLTKLVENKLSK
ncbi:hypothetical protein [Chryseobacterium sp.]|uniref:hypothetical protein n=1 Tax=Chryseobacterium sp. TaxID=1871047 RepID=UPI000EB92230|nr:hypothetical protein [Chryseobacterium sp.]HCA07738.1 hypothetical protein [Chryseobacterium sp.]